VDSDVVGQLHKAGIAPWYSHTTWSENGVAIRSCVTKLNDHMTLSPELRVRYDKMTAEEMQQNQVLETDCRKDWLCVYRSVGCAQPKRYAFHSKRVKL